LDDKKPMSAADSKLESLSRGELIDLVKLSSRMILALDGFWYLSVKELGGNDKALDVDNWVWDKVMKFCVDELHEGDAPQAGGPRSRGKGRGTEPE
jgi:hypothetical protein